MGFTKLDGITSEIIIGTTDGEKMSTKVQEIVWDIGLQKCKGRGKRYAEGKEFTV